MKKARNELIQFICGLTMFVVGLFLFTSKVNIKSTLYYGTLTIGNFSINSAVVLIPLLAGIIFYFIRPDKLAAKIIIGCGLLIILVASIVTTTVSIPHLHWYEWLVYFVLIAIGLVMFIRALLVMKKSENDSHGSKNERY